MGTAPSENRLFRASLMGSFDWAVSSGSLAFAADAVCYGNSIVLLLFDRFTTAWERHRDRQSVAGNGPEADDPDPRSQT